MPLTGTVVVTGGAGFIGSHIAAALSNSGARVRVLDDLSTGHRENLEEIGGDIDFIQGSVADEKLMRKALEGVEVVFHEAAIPSVPRSVENPTQSHVASVDGTFSLLLAARDQKVRRVVYAASSSAYGDQPTLPKSEAMLPDPLSPYAVAKLVGEYYCRVFTRVYGLETVALRYFNVFGPRQDPTSQYAAVVPRFIRAIADGRPVTVHGDGEQSRDFTYVENVVQANLLAADAPDGAGRVLNIATGGSETVNALAATIGSILDKPVEKTFGPAQPGDVRESWADVSSASETIGYEPSVGFEDGLRRTIDAMLQTKGAR